MVRHEGTVGILFRVMNPRGSSSKRPDAPVVLRLFSDAFNAHVPFQEFDEWPGILSFQVRCPALSLVLSSRGWVNHA